MWRYRAILFPRLAEALWWFVVYRVYQLGLVDRDDVFGRHNIKD
jgi:hypothetical protein